MSARFLGPRLCCAISNCCVLASVRSVTVRPGCTSKLPLVSLVLVNSSLSSIRHLVCGAVIGVGRVCCVCSSSLALFVTVRLSTTSHLPVSSSQPQFASGVSASLRQMAFTCVIHLAARQLQNPPKTVHSPRTCSRCGCTLTFLGSGCSRRLVRWYIRLVRRTLWSSRSSSSSWLSTRFRFWCTFRCGFLVNLGSPHCRQSFVLFCVNRSSIWSNSPTSCHVAFAPPWLQSTVNLSLPLCANGSARTLQLT